jgi:hypothetical protein
LGKLQAEVSVEPGQSQRCLTTTELGEISLRTQFLHASFTGRDTSLVLIGERYLHLPTAKLRASIVGNMVTITTDVFARCVSLEAPETVGAVFEDNFFDLRPGQTRTVKIIHPAGSNKVIVKALNTEPVDLTVAP